MSFQNTHMWLTQTEEFLKTRTEIKFLNLNVHQEWLVPTYVEMHMKMHQFSNKKATLAHISQQKSLPNWLQPENACYEWCTIPDDATVTQDDNHVRPYVEHQCWMNVAAINEGHNAGYIVEYGQKRLGGLFMRFDKCRKIVWMLCPFLQRELLCSTYFLKLLSAFARSQSYQQMGFEWIGVPMPAHLYERFEPILISAGASPIQAPIELAAMYRRDPSSLVMYLCSISNILSLTA
ncbi:hypothetical protein AAVH_12500 [Aphelenchoides avenae]|nr:hypothetical protein AAVH_12500 [Aphelenchus avenae]